MMDLIFNCTRATRAESKRGRLRDRGLFAFSFTKWLLIINNFHELGLMIRGQRTKVAAEEIVVDHRPYGIVPLELALHQGFKIRPGDMETNHVVKVSMESHAVDGDGNLHGGEMGNMLSWGKAFLDPVLRSERVHCDVVEGVAREGTRLFVRVLVALDPGNTNRTPEFFVEVSNRCEEVNVVGLAPSACAGACHHFHFADSRRAIDNPAKFAAMGKAPEAGDSGNQEKRSDKTTEFAAS